MINNYKILLETLLKEQNLAKGLVKSLEADLKSIEETEKKEEVNNG